MNKNIYFKINNFLFILIYFYLVPNVEIHDVHTEPVVQV
jgi:hypothetical protein